MGYCIVDEEEILNNMKFTNIMTDNIVSQPWLMNYEFEGVPMDDGKTGTVFSETWEEDGRHVVTPTIMEDIDSPGTLKYYGKDGPGYEEARGRGWGIPFENEKEAHDFANWLHGYHQLTGYTKSSYELGR